MRDEAARRLRRRRRPAARRPIAEAHLNSTGLGPAYDGLIHFLTSPEDLVSVLALALLAGLRGVEHGRRAVFVLPAASLLGMLSGLAAAATARRCARRGGRLARAAAGWSSPTPGFRFAR